jgi:hypothetical protein
VESVSRKFLVVSALVLASALTACSSDDGKNEEKKRKAELQVWAGKVCAIDVTARIDDARAALADVGKVVPGEQPATLKTRLAADVAKLADADNKLAEGIDRAGPPAVPDGPLLRTTVVAELQNTAKGWSAIQAKIEGLSTDRQNVFADGLRSLDPEIKAMQASSHTALDKLHRGEAGKALAAVPGCAAGKTDPAPTGAPSQPATPSAGASPSGSPGTPTQSASASPSSSPVPSAGSTTASPTGAAESSSPAPSGTSGTTAPPA